MKNIKKHKKNKNILYGIALVVLLTAAFALYFFFFVQKKPFSSPTSEEINLGNQISEQVKKNTSDGDTISNAGSDKQEPVRPVTQPADPINEKTINILLSSQNQSDTSLLLRFLIDAITSTGSCVLTLSNSDGATIVREAGVQAMANTTTCKGFDIPTDGMKKGTWNLLLEFSSGSQKGTLMKVIEIK